MGVAAVEGAVGETSAAVAIASSVYCSGVVRSASTPAANSAVAIGAGAVAAAGDCYPTSIEG